MVNLTHDPAGLEAAAIAEASARLSATLGAIAALMHDHPRERREAGALRMRELAAQWDGGPAAAACRLAADILLWDGPLVTAKGDAQ